MKLVSFGNTFHVYSDDVHTYDVLPAGYYRIEYDQMSGYSIKKLDHEFEINEKVYGVNQEKVRKVLNSYKLFQRNLGVLLSGNKGIGKSMFAKMLAIACVKQGLPVISVTNNTPGLATFLEDLNQEAMFLFDEFDKTFGFRDADKNVDAQSSLLTLFDGTTVLSKRLFVVTCNDLYNLNDFLVNRPGRFHYHFRFDYPSSEEIREYMQDKLDQSQWNQINEIIAFADKVNLNYDCLRSIAFEMSTGLSFVEAIRDLNIIAEDSYNDYDVTAIFNNGETIVAKKQRINMYDDDSCSVYFYVNNHCLCDVDFTPNSEDYLSRIGGSYLIEDFDNINWHIPDPNNEETEEKLPDWVKQLRVFKRSGIKEISIKRSKQKSLHYNFQAF